MKLKRLEFKGIGSFTDRMEIDLEALGSAGLFLIEGPTGSGKSTILDAIVFALYGSVAGANSDLGRLDSHLRDRSCAPFVELDFECGGSLYRIRRSPKHERDKKRGSGTTGDNGSVALIRMTPDPSDISHKASEVGDWILQTVGLTKQQFVSTVVLAQGEFASFLDADTADRARILEKVFGTEFYTHVEDQLVAMRKRASRECAAAAELVAAAVHECQGGLGLDDEVDLSDPLPALDDALASLRAQLSHAQTEVTTAAAELQKAHADHDAAVAQVDQQKKKAALLTRQQALTAERDRVELMREAIHDHASAAPLVPTIRAWEQASHQTEQAQRVADAARVVLHAVGVDEPASTSLLTEAATLLGTLQQPLVLESALDAERVRLTEMEQAADDATTDRSRIEARLHDLQEEISLARAQYSRCEDGSDRLAELLLLEADASHQSDLSAQWLAAQRTVVELTDWLSEASRQRDEAKARVDAAEAARTHNLAAELAMKLVEGQPCLVCGSAEHPAPALPEQTESAESDEVAALLTQCDEVCVARQHALSQALGRQEVLHAQLREGHEDASATLATLRAERADLEASSAAASKLRTRIEGLDTQYADAARDLTVVSLREQKALLAAEACAAAIARDSSVVQAARLGHPSVADRVRHVEELHAALKSGLSAQQTLQDRRSAAVRAQQLLTETLHSAGFDDVETARARLLDEATRATYDKAVSEWDRAVADVARDLDFLVDVDVDAPVDVRGLHQIAQECSDQHVRLTRIVNSLDDRITRSLPKRQCVEDRMQALQRVQEQTAAVIRMADLATANRSEVIHKVRLSSFVLMRRFQSVVEAANDRLDAISEGRYQLVVESYGLDKRGQAGLDLLIEDQRSEKCRSTKSLSGGERFYVSLALALGLADVVRSESGGVELGTLFIDEGFGSLDAEVLEEVMDMLEAVRVGEDRVIGLISHVEILKQRIDPRISVSRDPARPGVSTLEVRV